MRIWKMVLASLAVGGCATTAPSPQAASPGTYGLAHENPVEVCAPQGQRQYLARLVCPSGQHPDFKRRGSVGPRVPLPDNMTAEQTEALLKAMLSREPLAPGAPDHHTIDAYDVACGTVQTTIYMDMYHCDADAPKRAPAGFTITD